MYKVHGFFDNQMIIKYRMAHIPSVGDTVRIAGERYGKVMEIIYCTDERDPLGDTRVNIRVESEKEDTPAPENPQETPMQPIVIDPIGTPRFKENKIVSHMLTISTASLHDMNRIMAGDFTDEDKMQFAQLLGYSVSGYGGLSYASDESVETADLIAASLMEKKE